MSGVVNGVALNRKISVHCLRSCRDSDGTPPAWPPARRGSFRPGGSPKCWCANLSFANRTNEWRPDSAGLLPTKPPPPVVFRDILPKVPHVLVGTQTVKNPLVILIVYIRSWFWSSTEKCRSMHWKRRHPEIGWRRKKKFDRVESGRCACSRTVLKPA